MEDSRIEWLKENYATNSWEEVEKMFPERSRKQIRSIANRLGLKRGEMNKEGRIFSDSDTDWLKNNYAFASNQELQDKFPDIPLNKIRHKAAQIGLKKDYSIKGLGLSDEDLQWIVVNYPTAAWEEINQKFPHLTNEQIMHTAKRFKIKREECVRWPMFNEEDDAWLIKNFYNSDWDVIQKRFPNLTRQQIESRAYGKLGLKRPSIKFSEEEKDLIRKHYLDCKTVKEFKDRYMPQRNEENIRDWAIQMGLRKRAPWSKEEDQILLDNYYQMRRCELVKLIPWRTDDSICVRLKNLGLIGGAPGYQYTEDDYEFIRQNYMMMTDSEIGEVLHREAQSIKQLREKLKLYRRNPDEDTNYKSLNRFFARQSCMWRRLSIKKCDNICFLTGSEAQDVHHLYSRNLIIRDTLLALYLKNEDIVDINSCSKNLKSALLKEYKLQEQKHPFGIYLSEEVHYKFHGIYGSGDNTPEQFIEFVQNFFPNKLEQVKEYIQQNYNN